MLPEKYWYWILLAASFPYPVQLGSTMDPCSLISPRWTFFYVTLHPAVNCSVLAAAEEYKKFWFFSLFAALLFDSEFIQASNSGGTLDEFHAYPRERGLRILRSMSPSVA